MYCYQYTPFGRGPQESNLPNILKKVLYRLCKAKTLCDNNSRRIDVRPELSWIERWTPTPKAAGSTPVGRTKNPGQNDRDFLCPFLLYRCGRVCADPSPAKRSPGRRHPCKSHGRRKSAHFTKTEVTHLDSPAPSVPTRAQQQSAAEKPASHSGASAFHCLPHPVHLYRFSGPTVLSRLLWPRQRRPPAKNR